MYDVWHDDDPQNFVQASTPTEIKQAKLYQF